MRSLTKVLNKLYPSLRPSAIPQEKRMLFFALSISALYFLFYYFTDPVRPPNVFTGILGFHDTASTTLGWYGFIDQGSYLRLAHTLASFDSSQLSATFTYGLGYPLVAVPFIWLGFDADPFLFFNLFAFIFALYATYKFAFRFVSPQAGLISIFLLAFATPLVHYTDQPWNTTVSLSAVSAILLLATTKKMQSWHLTAVGLFIGLAFAARYVDAIFLGLLALGAIYRKQPRLQLLRHVGFLAIGVLFFTLPVLYAQYKVFGSPLRTPYVHHEMAGKQGSDQQLSSYSLSDVPDRAVDMLAGPRVTGRNDAHRGLLTEMFWMILAIPGIYIALRAKEGRLFFATLATFTIVVSVFYLSFRGAGVGSLKFGLLHYFKMLWPGVTIFSLIFMNRIVTKATKR